MALLPLMENYLQGFALTQAVITDQPITPVKNDILGYDEILAQMKQINELLKMENQIPFSPSAAAAMRI